MYARHRRRCGRLFECFSTDTLTFALIGEWGILQIYTIDKKLLLARVVIIL